MTLFGLFFALFLSPVSLADEPVTGAVAPSPRIVQTAEHPAGSATVIEIAGQQTVVWLGSKTIDYDSVLAIKFVNNDLLFRASRAGQEYFTVTVLDLIDTKLFVMADDGGNVYIDWQSRLMDCLPLLAVVRLADGTAHYITIDPRKSVLVPTEKPGPIVELGQNLPSHVCWVGENQLILLKIEPRVRSVDVDVWFAL